MKLASLALLALFAGCHHDTKATTTPVEMTAPPTTTTVSTPPAANVANDQKVSHTLAMSDELLKLCGIKSTASAADPKFAYDEDVLTGDDRNVLEQVATCMTTGPLKGKSVTLIGRADPRGTQEYNLALGSRRATSVSDYLQRFGVSKQNLTQISRGSLDATGTNDAGWAIDRRVDLQLTAN